MLPDVRALPPDGRGDGPLPGPRPGRDQLPRPPGGDRGGEGLLHGVQGVRHPAQGHAGHGGGALRPHRDVPARVRRGVRPAGGGAAARVHVQLPLQAGGARQGEFFSVKKEEVHIFFLASKCLYFGHAKKGYRQKKVIKKKRPGLSRPLLFCVDLRLPSACFRGLSPYSVSYASS